MNYKSKLITVLAGASVMMALTACQKEEVASNKLTVGAQNVPHAEILNEVVDDMAALGIELEVVEFADYLVMNPALVDGSIDANYFQHIPFLDSYNEGSGEELQWVGGIHIEPLGLYSNKITDLSQLKDGDQIAIPNDNANGPRALKLLADNGVITLDPAVTEDITIYNIIENPLNLEFIEVEAAQLPKTLEDTDASVINTNYALVAGLNPLNDSIIIESGEGSPYANGLVVRKGDETNENVLKLYDVLRTEEVKEFIINKYDGAVVPAF